MACIRAGVARNEVLVGIQQQRQSGWWLAAGAQPLENASPCKLQGPGLSLAHIIDSDTHFGAGLSWAGLGWARQAGQPLVFMYRVSVGHRPPTHLVDSPSPYHPPAKLIHCPDNTTATCERRLSRAGLGWVGLFHGWCPLTPCARSSNHRSPNIAIHRRTEGLAKIQSVQSDELATHPPGQSGGVGTGC